MAFTFDLNRDFAIDDGTIVETSRSIDTSIARTQLGYYVEADPEVPFDINNILNGDANALAISSTAVYNQLAGFCFPSQQYIPKSDDTSLTAEGVRIITIGRPTLEDRIKPGSITASVLTAGAATIDAFVYNDFPSTSNLSSLAPVGEIRGTLTTSLSASIVGTVFYDYGLIMFHGHDQIHDFDYTAKVPAGTCSGFHLNPLSSQDSINFNTQLVTEKFVKRGQYFCHVYNKEANFSTNPTFANVSGNVYSNLTGSPTTFITSVGLLNNAGEILAVAKVAPVVKKDFNSETVFKINLDY